ncbi:MAG: phosphotransferase family protein [Halioglobus sp.]
MSEDIKKPGNADTFSSVLSPTLIEWAETQAGGTLTALDRHVARREAYIAHFNSPEGDKLQSFLRLDRHPVPGSNVSLEREARICMALENTDIPVPGVTAWNAQHHIALFERVAGRADIDKLTDASMQRIVMEDFIDAIARLHLLDPASLALNEVLGSHALSPSQCALDDLEGQLAQFDKFVANYHDPLLHYGVAWLRRFAPTEVARVSLVQGDTGPVNFMFDGQGAKAHVSAIVDWEWGHWGDPMEDLGNICVREFWNPSGGLKGLFERYSQRSGIPYDANAVRYYRVQQNVRGMIPIHAVCQTRGMRESLAWYLAYREVGDRATCEALADAMNIAIEKPDLPAYEKPRDPLTDAALTGLSRDLAPELSSEFAQSRVRDIAILIECQDRIRRFEPEMQAQEISEIAKLLSSAPTDIEKSNLALRNAIESQSLPDETLIPYLARRAYRREWLFWPAATLYPDRTWSAID